MPRRLPPLNTLRLFEASARLGRLKAAAEELSLTPSAVSHGVRTLEAWLGLKLFVRSKQGLKLSDAGERYAATVRESLALLREGTEQLLGSRQEQRLAVSVAPFMATRWLLPLVARFRQDHPDITVLIDTLQHQVSLDTREADMAVRMGRGTWPGLACSLLFRERLVPVCAPELVDAVRAAPDHATYVHLRTVSEEWRTWCETTGRPYPPANRTFEVDTLQLAYDVAASGFGVAMGRRPLIDAALDNGTLVAPWPEVVDIETGYWLVAPARRVDEPVIGRFRELVMKEVGASEAP